MGYDGLMKPRIPIDRRCREMAESGRYLGYVEIEHALEDEGYRNARGFLDNRGIRAEIESLCDRARMEGRSDA